ncbi:MAG: hypothetical protein GY856_40675, partial [bacterium]|nr:hypothetical protein [bacterium]
DRLAGGRLLRRFLEIREGIVARELPVLLPPAGEGDPVGFLTGTIDLVYRDPATAELVVADFKTDVVGSGEVPPHSARYAAQLATYVRALREALDLTRPPRCELWYIEADWVAVSGGVNPRL